jgi:agmatinase
VTFPGASSTRDEADYVVTGAPLDVSTTFQPGARFGPRRVRHFAKTFDDYDHRTDRHFSALAVHDAGDVHAWDEAADYLDFLEGELRAIRRDGAVPLTIGGEHTISAAGVRAVDADVFVCIDAHLDLRSEYDGNPLSHATVTRRILESADRAVILGARTGSESEWDRAAVDDVTVVPPDEVPGWSADIEPSATLYLSVDIDGLDPGFAPGTGTLEPFGLQPRAVRDVVRSLAPRATGFDIVEVNDRDDGQAAALAGKLLREFAFAHAEGTQ